MGTKIGVDAAIAYDGLEIGLSELTPTDHS